MSETGTKREPFERVLSENVMIYFGYKDGHAEVKVRIPIYIPLIGEWYRQQVPMDAIEQFKINFDDAFEYGRKPPHERKREEPVEFEARSDCRGRWGYDDGHVELGVWKLKWWWIDFPFDEFLLAKKAMDEAHVWAQLPDHVREMQGV